jgi:Ca2+-binding RTX toxin-like protein
MRGKFVVLLVVLLFVLSASNVMAPKVNKIHGTNSNDPNLEGTDGPDKIWGHHGNDNINGKGGDDTIIGGSGNDNVKGGKGNDTIKGDQGHDDLDGGDDDDDIQGGGGNDNITGGNGDDDLSGGRGNDNVTGGNGTDNLNGGPGNDVINGGRGNDTYEVKKNDGNDVIVINPGDVPPGQSEDIKCGCGKDSVQMGKGFPPDSIEVDPDTGQRTIRDPLGGTYKVGDDCEGITQQH